MNPIPMILYCPDCHKQHIDVATETWPNPPHKTHQCQHCGREWKPCNFHTVGVAELPPAQHSFMVSGLSLEAIVRNLIKTDGNAGKILQCVAKESGLVLEVHAEARKLLARMPISDRYAEGIYFRNADGLVTYEHFAPEFAPDWVKEFRDKHPPAKQRISVDIDHPYSIDLEVVNDRAALHEETLRAIVERSTPATINVKSGEWLFRAKRVDGDTYETIDAIQLAAMLAAMPVQRRGVKMQDLPHINKIDSHIREIVHRIVDIQAQKIHLISIRGTTKSNLPWSHTLSEKDSVRGVAAIIDELRQQISYYVTELRGLGVDIPADWTPPDVGDTLAPPAKA